MDEFGFIASMLSPLAAKEKGALGLKDDAAVLTVPKGHELVVTKDAITQGVHFIGDEPPSLIARKLLRVNLSDLAAMGAMPWGYFLALLLPRSADEGWLKDFCKGLCQDQNEYGITLMGGDTTRSDTLSLSITALGLVPKGKALKRTGAKAGDGIYVSGTIGDGALGLQAARGRLRTKGSAFLKRRYQLPQPRVKLGQALRGMATACIDISDGLMQDLGHVCAASHTGAEIYWQDVPLSEAARLALKTIPYPYETVLAGGDDYELLFTAPASMERKLKNIAQSTGTAITRIGHMRKQRGVDAVDAQGRAIMLRKTGWRHF